MSASLVFPSTTLGKVVLEPSLLFHCLQNSVVSLFISDSYKTSLILSLSIALNRLIASLYTYVSFFLHSSIRPALGLPTVNHAVCDPIAVSLRVFNSSFHQDFNVGPC